MREPLWKWLFRRLPAQVIVALPDHDLSVLKETPTSSKWRHSYSCTECRAPVGHEEFMTKICLSCGQQMRRLPDAAAMRQVVLDGRWQDTLKVGGVEYVKRDGEWVPVFFAANPQGERR